VKKNKNKNKNKNKEYNDYHHTTAHSIHNTTPKKTPIYISLSLKNAEKKPINLKRGVSKKPHSIESSHHYNNSKNPYQPDHGARVWDIHIPSIPSNSFRNRLKKQKQNKNKTKKTKTKTRGPPERGSPYLAKTALPR
jgi:hypothetical protein